MKHKPWLGTFEEELYDGMQPVTSNWVANVGFRTKKRNCLRCGNEFLTHPAYYLCDNCKSVNKEYKHTDGG